ncbi:MAG: lipopolysaccharide biosynthesis protein [Pseudonocardia sp.]
MNQRKKLPGTGGFGPVGVGLALIALSAYAVLALAGHVLAPADFAAVGSLYLLVSVVGPGVFVAVEQQTNREVSGRIAAGMGWTPVLRSGAAVSAGLAGLTTLGVLALSPVLVPRVFGGSWVLLGAAVLAVWGAAAGYLLRGAHAGQRRYGWYAAGMGLEGVARAGACVGLVLAGVTDAGWYGLVFGFGLVVSAVLTLAGPRDGDLAAIPGPPHPPARMAGQVGLLAGASGLTLVVANLGPVVLTSRLAGDPGQAALAASFVSLFVLARIPVLLVAPVQAILLPRLAAAAEQAALGELATQVRAAVRGVLAVGVPGVLLAAVAGPWAAQLFFDAPVRLSWLVAGLLGVGTLGMMTAQMVQPALVALGRNRAATFAWGIGAAVFVLLLALPGIPLAAAVTAQAVAPAVVTGLMVRELRASLVERDAAPTQT